MFFLAVFLFTFCAASVLQSIFNSLFSSSDTTRHSGYSRNDSASCPCESSFFSCQSKRSRNRNRRSTSPTADNSVNVNGQQNNETEPVSANATNAAISTQISDFAQDQGWTGPVYPFFRTESKTVSVIGRKRTIVQHRIVDRIIVGVYRVGDDNTLHVAFAVDRNTENNPFVYNRTYKKQIRTRLLETALVRLARNPVVVSIDDNLAKAISTVDTSNKFEIVRFDKNAIVPVLRKIMMNYTSSRYSIVSNLSIQPVWDRPNRKNKSTFTKLGEGPFVGAFSLIESPI